MSSNACPSCRNPLLLNPSDVVNMKETPRWRCAHCGQVNYSTTIKEINSVAGSIYSVSRDAYDIAVQTGLRRILRRKNIPLEATPT